MIFAITTNEGWEPGIGDPTLAGWFTVFAYLMTAFFCWRAARAALPAWAKTGNSRPVLFWISFSILLLLLGINKQLDLQTWFTEIGRNVAKAQGWYEERQLVQVAFIVLFAGGGLALLAILRRLTVGSFRDCRTALIGGVFLLCFVLMRASSFHHVDHLLGMRLAGLKINWLLELGGISCVALGAWQFLVRHSVRARKVPFAAKVAPRA